MFAKLVSILGWAIIAAGILIPLVRYFVVEIDTDSFEQIYHYSLKSYVHRADGLFGFTLPAVVLGIVLVACAKKIIQLRDRLDKLEQEQDTQNNRD